MKWHFVEMHCHTRHSDGSFTPSELAQAARDEQLDGIALTDHNTMSGHRGLRETGLPFIPGIEWTTFFGHMLVLGAREYVDWRDATPDNIDDKMRAVHAAGGLVGVAHPFDLGSPMCTGCYWDFRVQDWHNVDYIEVWHEGFPTIQWNVRRAKDLWIRHLDEGCRIAPMYGRDWHGPALAPQPCAVTMLGTDADAFTAEGGYEAVRRGRVMLTMGPAVYWQIEQDGRRFDMGDAIRPGRCAMTVSVDDTARRAVWERFGVCAEQAVFYGRGGAELARVPLSDGPTVCVLNVEAPYVRMEVQGRCMGRDCTVAISAPVYVET